MSALAMENSMIVGEMERGGELRRFMFATELTGTIGTKTEKEVESSSTYTWNPDQLPTMFKKGSFIADELDCLRQTLVVRRLVLGPSAKEGEENWVNVEVTDPEGLDSKFPLGCLIRGKESQTLVDLAFPDVRDVRVKFTLVEGTGPVHVVGYHLIERLPPYESQDDECEEEEVDEEDEGEGTSGDDAEEKIVVKPPTTIRAKRRINGENANGDAAVAKKIKTGDVSMEDESTSEADAKK